MLLYIVSYWMAAFNWFSIHVNIFSWKFIDTDSILSSETWAHLNNVSTGNFSHFRRNELMNKFCLRTFRWTEKSPLLYFQTLESKLLFLNLLIHSNEFSCSHSIQKFLCAIIFFSLFLFYICASEILTLTTKVSGKKNERKVQAFIFRCITSAVNVSITCRRFFCAADRKVGKEWEKWQK